MGDYCLFVVDSDESLMCLVVVSVFSYVRF